MSIFLRHCNDATYSDCSSVPDDSYCIYSCGDGNILMHDRRNMNKRATDVNTVIKQANGNEVNSSLLTLRGKEVIVIYRIEWQ